MSVLTLLIAFSTLVAAVVTIVIAVNLDNTDRSYANYSACLNQVMVARSALTQLEAGYVTEPYAKPARLRDWYGAEGSIDAVSVSCNQAFSRLKTRSADFSRLQATFQNQFKSAPNGFWDPSATRALLDWSNKAVPDILGLER